jgi:hypothetical protein
MKYNKEFNYGVFEDFAFKIVDNVVEYADEELNVHKTDQEYYDWEERLWAELETA